MADVVQPGTCLACGRQLPTQQGRGRTRQYCDAKCRNAARRRRARSSRQEEQNVKRDLTLLGRHEYLDTIDEMPGTGDPVADRVATAARRLLAELGRPGSPQRAIAAGRDLSAAAEAALEAAVDRARATGQSWREIGDVLGTSRQAAFQRFGHPVDPRTGDPMSRTVATGAIEQATEFLASFTAGRWEEVLGKLNDRMRERHDVNLLASGWAQMIGRYGSYEGMGKVRPVPVGDGIVVDVLLRFEAGEAMFWVGFDPDGRVTGMRLHRAAL